MSGKFKRILAKAATPGKYRYFLIVACGYLFTAILIALSITWAKARIDANIEAVAYERGLALFDQFELARAWNRQHGGVYVSIIGRDRIEPTEHASEGKPLMRANDAEMMRQIAELSEFGEGIRYRLVELQPDAPGNQPDAWEAETLQLFQKMDLKDRLTFFPEVGASRHRFMALLEYGNQPGEHRLALSITMPANKLLAIRSEQFGSMLMMHFAAFVFIGGLAHLAARRTYRHFSKLTALAANQKFLIEERTADLSMANTLLAAEVEERTTNQTRLQESESRYRLVVESTQDGIALIEGDRITFANSRLAEILAMPLNNILGTIWTDLLPEEDREAAATYRMRKLKGDDLPICLRSHMRHGNSATPCITVDLQMLPIKGSGNGDAQWVLNARNVSDRLRAERDQKIVAAVFNSTTEAIMVTDRNNRIAMINPAFSRITGYPAEEVIGKSATILSSGRHDRNFYSDMWRHIRETGSWEGEIWNRRKDGSLYVEWLTITALNFGEGDNRLTDTEACHLATFNDITHRKEAEDLLRHKASHDALTGLPNRSLFEDRLRLAISQSKRHRRSFALLYIDLDHFKEVNDTLGHAAGDELLTETARRMTLCIRESDTLSRLGGDEFAALLSEVDSLEEIEEIAGRIVAALDQPFELDQGVAKISGSVGIAIYPQHGVTAEQLMNNADQALYQVKESTRNAYRLYSADGRPETEQA